MVADGPVKQEIHRVAAAQTVLPVAERANSLVKRNQSRRLIGPAIGEL